MVATALHADYYYNGFKRLWPTVEKIKDWRHFTAKAKHQIYLWAVSGIENVPFFGL